MIVTLKINLLCGRYCESEWCANIELDEESTLEQLHDAIQMAVEFDNDHLCCFFESRTERSRDRVYYDDENGLLFRKTVQDLFPLPPKQSLYYLFDWGDEWLFKVSPTRKRAQLPVAGATYPRMTDEAGAKPVQYPGLVDDDEDDEE